MDHSVTGSGIRWHEVPDHQALQRTAIERILAAAAQAIAGRGEFHIVLAGGETPRSIYSRLRDAKADWASWNVYFGDERCLPAGNEGRNSRMARDAWLDHVPIPAGQSHPIPGELGALKATEAYTGVLQAAGEFDLVLLGLGEDGHTASLFPGHEWGNLAGAPDVMAIFDAPKPPPERVTMSAARLSRARQVMFLVAGEAKHRAVAAWRAGKNIPARAITPAGGVDVLLESTLLVPLAV